MGLEHVKRALGMAWRGFGLFPDSSHPVCSEDIVVPIGVFDNNFIIRNQFIRLVYRVDCVLDATKLRTTLEELIALQGWEKLGARLRSVNGKLEYHIPASFGPDRPPLRFRLQDLSARTIHDHSVIARPCDTENPTIATSSLQTSQFFEDHADIGYFITQDVPLFGLGIVRFADATLLCLSWPHVLMDGAGIGLLLRSWAACLSNGDKALRRPCKPTDEPLSHLGLQASSRFWLEDRLRSTFSFILEFSLFQNTAALLEGTEPRSVSLPARFVHSLRDQLSASDYPTTRSEFVSEGDLISAWWIKQVTSRCMSRFVQTIVVYQLVALHSRTDSRLRDLDLAYIGNAIGFVPTLISRSDLEQDSVVDLALRMRNSLDNTVEATQLNAWAALFRESSFQLMPNFGQGATFSLVISNTSKLKVMDIDFSGAVLQAAGSKTPPSSMPSAIYNFQDFAFPNFFTIIAKDQLKNTIITGNLRRKEWEAIEKDWVAGEFNSPPPRPIARL